MGFVDLNGALGRRFGSFGLAIDTPRTMLEVSPGGDGVAASGPGAERAQRFGTAFLRNVGRDVAVSISVGEAICAHAGLGSGTQLALAVGRGIARLLELDVEARDIARMTRRGARSGIGIGAFERGGFILDGGRGSIDEVPPIVSQMPCPQQWRVILVFDEQRTGIHGAHENKAFADLPAFPERHAERVCRLMLMQALPAVATADIGAFGAAINEIQRFIGAHFSAAQGGRYASPRVANALEWLAANGAAGVGQTSWGPTGFALCEDRDLAGLLAGLSARIVGETGLRAEPCVPRNEGAVVTVRGRRHASHAT